MRAESKTDKGAASAASANQPMDNPPPNAMVRKFRPVSVHFVLKCTPLYLAASNINRSFLCLSEDEGLNSVRHFYVILLHSLRWFGLLACFEKLRLPTSYQGMFRTIWPMGPKSIFDTFDFIDDLKLGRKIKEISSPLNLNVFFVPP